MKNALNKPKNLPEYQLIHRILEAISDSIGPMVSARIFTDFAASLLKKQSGMTISKERAEWLDSIRQELLKPIFRQPK